MILPVFVCSNNLFWVQRCYGWLLGMPRFMVLKSKCPRKNTRDLLLLSRSCLHKDKLEVCTYVNKSKEPQKL